LISGNLINPMLAKVRLHGPVWLRYRKPFRNCRVYVEAAKLLTALLWIYAIPRAADVHVCCPSTLTPVVAVDGN